MGKRILLWLLAGVLTLQFLPSVQGAQGPEISAPSAILMEKETGTVLYEKNAKEKLAPASVTKIMTLLLVMEALDAGQITLEDSVVASEAAAGKGGSQIYLEAGETMSLEEMLKSVVVSSANDCATALAEHIAGSEEAFVERMNQRAAELGMEDSHFVNCTGLDDDADAGEHLTTAYDIALMSRALLQHEGIKAYTTIWMDTVRNGTFGLSNTNKLVRFYEGATGLKTGYTSAAGHCLSASAERDGMELIAVVLHCDSSTDRFQSAKSLLSYGFANYALVELCTEDPLPTVQIRLGKTSVLSPVLQDRAPILIPKEEQSRITKTVSLPRELTAPLAAGQQVGTLTVSAGERVLAEIPLVSPEAIERPGLWEMTLRLLRRACMGQQPSEEALSLSGGER